MASVHTITHALSSIAARVNAHQILLEDLKNTVHNDNAEGNEKPFENGSTVIAPSVPEIDYEEVKRIVDLKITELKDELSHKSNREKAILETSIQHSVTQKVSSAVADIDQRNAIRLLQERVKELETKLSDVSTGSLSAMDTAPPAETTPGANNAVPTDTEATAPEGSGGGDLRNDTESETLKKAVPRPRPSRRRAKAAEKDDTGKESTTLTLE